MSWSEEGGKEMDEAAAKAQTELQSMIEKDPALRAAVAKLAEWWTKWFMKAGHKRLGRVLKEIR